ncbi:MAG TPA: hypothetical protein VLC07_08065 [Solirubrobacterales bacterium]|nr:hypothetical protein [Solirubrobacterales bacterium]
MKTHDLDARFKAANPYPSEVLAALEIAAAEAELGEAIVAGPASAGGGVGAGGAMRSRRSRWRRRLGLAVAGGLAMIAAAVVIFSGGGEGGSNRAYGAELVRFAEASPLLLLEGPGWRVQNADEQRTREGVEGTMEFVTGKPVPYETIHITGAGADERARGLLPAAVRQRRVDLGWRPGNLSEAIGIQRRNPHPHGQDWLKLPVLDTTAVVDTRAEFYANLGRPGDRRMIAFWSEDGFVLQLTAWVPDLAAFEERLGWLTKVDTQTWLDAMPAKVVKAADHDAAVREMLKGIPVPSTFKPSKIPDEGLSVTRYQVGASVTATVSCLWFLQWAEARRSGDRPGELEAEQAMATSRRWPILHEMAKDGAFPETIWQLAKEMPSGVWVHTGHRHPLLPRAEGLGCARLGLPLLPRKQKLQRERGPPLPPR